MLYETSSERIKKTYMKTLKYSYGLTKWREKNPEAFLAGTGGTGSPRRCFRAPCRGSYHESPSTSASPTDTATAAFFHEERTKLILGE